MIFCSKETIGTFFAYLNFFTNFSQCQSATDKTMKGTCYTSSECTGRGGNAGGNCAAGMNKNNF